MTATDHASRAGRDRRRPPARASASASARRSSAFGIETVLDLLTTYPRRWVDRTNEARVARPRAPATRRSCSSPSARSPSGMLRNRRTMVDGHRRRRHRAPAGRVLQPAVARAPAHRGPAGRPVRQGRRVPRRAADDEPDRRPDRRPHRSHRADLPAEREGPAHHVGDRRLGRERARTLPTARRRRSGARRGAPSTRPDRARRRAARRSTSPRRCARRRPPGAGWRSTSCCACSWCS